MISEKLSSMFSKFQAPSFHALTNPYYVSIYRSADIDFNLHLAPLDMLSFHQIHTRGTLSVHDHLCA